MYVGMFISFITQIKQRVNNAYNKQDKKNKQLRMLIVNVNHPRQGEISCLKQKLKT